MANDGKIVIQKNNSDIAVYSPRAVIAIYSMAIRQIETRQVKKQGDGISIGDKSKGIKDYIELSKKILIMDDILALRCDSHKSGISNSMSATLAPSNDVDYLHIAAPGDYVMCWIVNSQEQLSKIVDNFKNDKQNNQFDSGLKFFGQLFSIQENFQVGQNGERILRYNLTAGGFNFYNGQVFISPFLTGNNDNVASIWPNGIFANLNTICEADDRKSAGEDVVREIQANELSIQEQFIALHSCFLGPGPGKGADKNPITTANGIFALPPILLDVFGKKLDTSGSKLSTIADLLNVIIGVQSFDNLQDEDGKLGPSNVKIRDPLTKDGRSFGTYFVAEDEAYRLKGRKALNLPPTLGGTIYSILQQCTNSTINELYCTLRPSPTKDSEIVPSLILRQLPFSSRNDIKTTDKEGNEITFSNTPFLSLPRFELKNDMVIAHSINRSESLRTNAFMISMDASINGKGAQQVYDVLATAEGPWNYDPDDVKRHGMRFYTAKVDQDFFDLKKPEFKIVSSYASFMADIMNNLHLKYTGNISSVGIIEPICVGENLEYNDLVFHIEGVNHTYQIMNGLPIFRTNLTLSHGVPFDGDITFNDRNPDDFKIKEMHGSFIKESRNPTLVKDFNKPVMAGDSPDHSNVA